MNLLKAKYIKRSRGKDGKWKYVYKRSDISAAKNNNEQISERLMDLIKRVQFRPEKINGSFLLKDKFGRKVEITEKEYVQSKKYIESGMKNPVKVNNSLTSKEFKSWFEGSKAVDDKGNPLVVFHGSTKKLDQITPGYDESGAWFTTSRKTASNYVKGDTGHLHSLYLSAKTPLVADFSNITGDTIKINGIEFDDNESIAKYAEDEGYDSVQFPVGNFTEDDETWVVFDSSQIKSTDNIGAFDKNNPDIRKSIMIIIRKSTNLTGKGDDFTLEKISEKHGVPLEKINKEYSMGLKVELEHTKDPGIASQIAIDHLTEMADYYSQLAEMEGDIEKAITSDDKVAQVMREFKDGTLTSHGKPVTDRKQALAIAMSEAGMSKAVKDLNYWKKKLMAALSGEKMSKSIIMLKGKSYPIGTKRTWSGKTYKKVAGGASGKGKWVRTYTGTEGRGEKQAIRNVMRKIQNASSMEELSQIISENMSRFKTEDGKTLPVVKEFMSAARGTGAGTKEKKFDGPKATDPELERTRKVHEGRSLSINKMNLEEAKNNLKDETRPAMKEAIKTGIKQLEEVISEKEKKDSAVSSPKQKIVVKKPSQSREQKKKQTAKDIKDILSAYRSGWGVNQDFFDKYDSLTKKDKKMLEDTHYVRPSSIEELRTEFNKKAEAPKIKKSRIIIRKSISKKVISPLNKGIDFSKRLESLRKRRGETKQQFDANFHREMKNITDPPAEYDHNYKLQGYRYCHGLKIAIENKRGSYRSGKDPNGKPWKVKMIADYGRIQGTKATDSEAVDVYVGPDDTATRVYVVHQQDPFRGVYDEDKVFLYYPSKESVIEAYLSQYNRPDFLGPISEFSIPDFKEALKERRGNMLYQSPIMLKTKIVIRRKK